MSLITNIGQPKYRIQAGTVIDFSDNAVILDSISANKNYTFSNVVNGYSVTLVVINTSGGAISLNFGSTFWSFGIVINTVNAGSRNIYTFIVTNGQIHVSVVDRMS